MTTIEATAILNDTISGDKRHKNYEREVYLASWCQGMMTGKGPVTEKIIKAYRHKETDEQKEERLMLTNSLTGFALNPIYLLYKKSYRADGIREEIIHPDEAKKMIVDKALDGFYGPQKGVDYYLRERLLNGEFYDPNRWLIVDRIDTRLSDGSITSIQPYPFEVSAEQAINYHIENNRPVWLIARHQRMETVVRSKSTSTQAVHDYFFYAAGLMIKYQEYLKDSQVVPDAPDYIQVRETGSKKTRLFAAWYYETGSEEFPGDKVGAYPDPESPDNCVKVPPYYPAAPVLTDMIWDKSSLDLTKRKHVYPKRHQYTADCDYVPAIGHGDPCNGGYLDDAKTVACPKCKGTGEMTHSGEQDVLKYRLPKDLQDIRGQLIPLSSLVFYEDTPEWIPRYLEECIERDRLRVHIAVFNTSAEERPTVAKTATEINVSWDEVNNVVIEHANRASYMYELIARISAQYLGVSDGFDARRQVPHDLKLEPMESLIARYDAAKKAGMPYEVVWGINEDIITKQYRNNPDRIAFIKAKEKHRPFRSKDEGSAAAIIQTRSQTDPTRVLYENFDLIFVRIEEKLKTGDQPAFAEVPFARQTELVMEQIEILIQEIEYAAPESAMSMLFTEPDNGQ